VINVKYCQHNYIHATNDLCFNALIHQNNEFLKFTDNKINITQNGGFYNTIYLLWLEKQYKYINEVQFETVSNKNEYNALNDTSGAFSWVNDEFIGYLYKIDINCMYGYLLINNKFPIKEGEYLKIDNVDNDIKYGIYYCDIEAKNNIYFRENKNKCYTHTDLLFF
jgi:hypothetical protein